MSDCTCTMTDPKYWFCYGGAVEPGSQYEPDFDCPKHFPDAPAPPPFEVPWGTLQRDKSGSIWNFFASEMHSEGVVGQVNGHGQPAKIAAAYAPFTRLYTVQELADVIERVAGKQTKVSRQLLHMQEVGDV